MKALFLFCIAMPALTGIRTIPFAASQIAKLNSEGARASAGAVFGMFHAHRQARGIALLWSVSDPANVLDFEIEKSYDGEFFDPLDSAPCNNQSLMRYQDNNVFPGYIHYRIKAILVNGMIEYSDVQTVRIVQRR